MPNSNSARYKPSGTKNILNIATHKHDGTQTAKRSQHVHYTVTNLVDSYNSGAT